MRDQGLAEQTAEEFSGVTIAAAARQDTTSNVELSATAQDALLQPVFRQRARRARMARSALRGARNESFKLFRVR